MSYKIIGKYIKDLNFSIPNPKTFLLLSKDISNYKINIDIKSNQVKEKIIDVQTTLNLSPIKNNFEKINTKIVYSTIIELTDGISDKKEIEKICTKIIYSTIIELENTVVDKEEIEKIILIEVPSKIYPELRKIFIFVFENSGFKEIKISENVDFQKLYELRKIQ